MTTPTTRPGIWARNRKFLTTVAIVAACLAAYGGLMALRDANAEQALEQLDVQVTSCSEAGGIAKVGYLVTNGSDRERRTTLTIEYRDSAARLGGDTARLTVPAGDTARGETSTALTATPNGAVTCRIVSVS